jgi:hypothetical protein
MFSIWEDLKISCNVYSVTPLPHKHVLLLWTFQTEAQKTSIVYIEDVVDIDKFFVLFLHLGIGWTYDTSSHLNALFFSLQLAWIAL